MKTKDDIKIEYLESIIDIQETQITNRDQYIEALEGSIEYYQELFKEHIYKKL